MRCEAYFRNIQEIVPYQNIRSDQMMELEREWEVDIKKFATTRPVLNLVGVF
jgi:hypothetical protein